jgi:hypothetical protein
MVIGNRLVCVMFYSVKEQNVCETGKKEKFIPEVFLRRI